jgi:hypothetical protein
MYYIYYKTRFVYNNIGDKITLKLRFQRYFNSLLYSTD